MLVLKESDRNRFLGYISIPYPISKNGCWEWKGSKESPNKKIRGAIGGYGNFWLMGRAYKAHRISYEMFVKKIPRGKEIDHLCRNRSCVNPKHLQAVSHKVNMQRKPGYGTCKKGHNLNITGKIYEDNKRRCKICRVTRMRKYAIWYRKNKLLSSST